MVIPRQLYNNCEYCPSQCVIFHSQAREIVHSAGDNIHQYAWNNPIIKYLLHVQDTTIVNVYFAGFLSTSFTLHTTVSFHLLSSCSSGYKCMRYRCRYVFFSAFSDVLLSFPAPKYEYSLHRQSSLNSSGTNRCVNRTPKCPGLWLWCFSLVIHDIIWALGCRKWFLVLLVELLVADPLVELHVFVQLLVADPE